MRCHYVARKVVKCHYVARKVVCCKGHGWMPISCNLTFRVEWYSALKRVKLLWTRRKWVVKIHHMSTCKTWPLEVDCTDYDEHTTLEKLYIQSTRNWKALKFFHKDSDCVIVNRQCWMPRHKAQALQQTIVSPSIEVLWRMALPLQGSTAPCDTSCTKVFQIHLQLFKGEFRPSHDTVSFHYM